MTLLSVFSIQTSNRNHKRGFDLPNVKNNNMTVFDTNTLAVFKHVIIYNSFIKSLA